MKVYEIIVKRNIPFIFYLRDGIITLAYEEEYPIPMASTLWNKDGTWTYRFKNIPDKIICPAICVQEEDYYDFIKVQMQPLIEHTADNFGINKHNLIFFKKDMGDGILEVGMCAHVGKMHHPNEKLQKICDSILNLKTFW